VLGVPCHCTQRQVESFLSSKHWKGPHYCLPSQIVLNRATASVWLLSMHGKAFVSGQRGSGIPRVRVDEMLIGRPKTVCLQTTYGIPCTPVDKIAIGRYRRTMEQRCHIRRVAASLAESETNIDGKAQILVCIPPMSELPLRREQSNSPKRGA